MVKIFKTNERVIAPHEGMVTTEFGNNIYHFGAEEDIQFKEIYKKHFMKIIRALAEDICNRGEN